MNGSFTPASKIEGPGSEKSTTLVLPTEKVGLGVNGLLDNLIIYNKYYSDLDMDVGLYGEGTEQSPYLISTAQDLANLSVITMNESNAAKYYRLANDIDISGITFSPIGTVTPFTGVFDGGGHSISYLNIDRPNATHVGLFATINDGTVKNVGIESGTITGMSRVGGIAGRTLRATIINCYNNATVKGGDAGGIVGQFNSSTMLNCYNQGDVGIEGVLSVGGLIGASNGSVDTSVKARSENSYSTGQVIGGNYVGAAIGYLETQEEYAQIYRNVYYDTSFGKGTGFGNIIDEIKGLTTEQMTDGTLLDSLNDGAAEGYYQWQKDENGYPVHLTDDVDLSKLLELVEQCVRLKEADYTADSWKIFYPYPQDAQAVLDNESATQADINLAYDLLKVAISFLVPATSEEVDKTLLQIVVDLAQKAVGSGEVDNAIESVRNDFNEAFEAAKAILDNEDATQDEVNQAYERLSEILNRLGFIKGDKTALQQLYDLLSKLNLRDYEAGEAKEAFNTAMQKAADILADGDAMAEDVDEAYAGLMLTSSKLVRLDRSRLASEIIKSEEIKADLDKYVEAGKEGFLAALEAAKTVLEADEVTQAQIDAARIALAIARANLRFKADKSILEGLMTTARSLDLGLYTDESVIRLRAAMDEAQKIADNDNLSVDDQESVNNTAKILSDALDLIQLKATDGSSSGGDGNSSTSSNPSGDKDSANAAKTGDTTIVLFAVAAMLTLVVTVAIRKRSKTKYIHTIK